MMRGAWADDTTEQKFFQLSPVMLSKITRICVGWGVGGGRLLAVATTSFAIFQSTADSLYVSRLMPLLSLLHFSELSNYFV